MTAITKKETGLVEAQSTQIAQQVRSPADMLNVVSQLAMHPDADIDKIERMMGLYERLQEKENEAKFNNVMADVQAEIGTIKFNSFNQQTQSQYANLSGILKKVKPIYTRHGMSLSYSTEPQDNDTIVRVVCLCSVAGYTRRYEYDSPITDKGIKGTTMMTTAHARGSAMSYGRRYLTAMIFNLDTADDDDAASFLSNIEYVTGEQVANIEALIEETGANKSNFLRVLKVEDLEHLPASKYDGAVQRLEERRNQ